jgi:hypothetical protein
MLCVDAVLCWVDGSDVSWIAQKAKYDQSLPLADNGATRYTNCDELRFCLRSLADHAPWIRHVWVITAGQTPSWWKPSAWASLVDHRDIMPASALPTFNSLAIETCMHRIAGLAEHFIYLNDDFFFGKRVEPSDFFTKDGRMIHQWGPVASAPCKPFSECSNAYHHAVATSLALLPHLFTKKAVTQIAMLPPHHAMPKTITACERAWTLFPDALACTRDLKFRQAGMVIHYLANYIAMLENKALLYPRMLGRFYETFLLVPKDEPLPVHICINKVHDAKDFALFMTMHFKTPSPAETGQHQIIGARLVGKLQYGTHSSRFGRARPYAPMERSTP